MVKSKNSTAQLLHVFVFINELSKKKFVKLTQANEITQLHATG